MDLNVMLDGQGFLPDAYGKYAAVDDQAGRLCVRSFPWEATDLPQGTAAIAWIFMDWDSVPVCCFPWMHWCAFMPVEAGADEVALPDDASRLGMPGMVQGKNSAAREEGIPGCAYVGPCPPNCDHVYTLHAVALDEVPALAEGFWANELVTACKGHVLAEAAIDLPSRC